MLFPSRRRVGPRTGGPRSALLDWRAISSRARHRYHVRGAHFSFWKSGRASPARTKKKAKRNRHRAKWNAIDGGKKLAYANQLIGDDAECALDSLGAVRAAHLPERCRGDEQAEEREEERADPAPPANRD